MSAGIFPTAQPQYAAHGIATFPVGVNKRPSVRGYPRIGLRASTELASKFADAPGLGFMCGARSRVTVLDVDTSDERLVADALSRHGPTPIVVRTASGKFHGWYRHNDERRRIRPWGDDCPIDLLGTGGFVIAPPSTTERGRYEFVQGSLDDLTSLPRMRGLEASVYIPSSRDCPRRLLGRGGHRRGGRCNPASRIGGTAQRYTLQALHAASSPMR